MDTPTRFKIDLSGVWDYAVDGGPSGSVKVPSAYDFRGKVAFQRGIDLTKEQLDQYKFQIVMLGVNHAAEVTVNGEFVTSHSGGASSVVEPLPRNALQIGRENTVRIVVNNELDARTTLPIRPPVWGLRNYGGITRDIYLLGTPPLYLKDAVVTADPSDNGEAAKIVVRVTPEGADSISDAAPAGNARIPASGFFFEVVDKMSGALVVRSPLAPLVHKGNEWEDASAAVVMQEPRLWSPETPDLYIVKCYLAHPSSGGPQVVDEYDVTAGVRRIAVAGEHLELNGKRLQVRGVCWYEDSPAHGSAMTYEEREKDVALIKTLGANVIRFIDRPPHPYMLNLCDRYGLLAMEEIPLVQVPGEVLSSDAFADLASTALRETIVRDRNHPSVLAWGLGDEIEAGHPSARAFMQSLVRLARTLDARPLYCAVTPGPDSCTSLMDIAALSVNTQDLKAFRTQVETWRDAHRHQPLVVVKFGTEVQTENRNGYSDPLSQEAQARFYLQRFDILKSIDCEGGIVWSFDDWKGDRPSLTVRSGNPWMHTQGLVTAGREKRLAFDAVRSVFHGEKFVALPAGTRPGGAPIVYVLAGFVLLVGMAYVYNSSRRFRESLNRAVLNSYNFFADVRDQRIVATGHSTLLGVVIALALAISASSILYRFRDSMLLDGALSSLLVGDDAKAAAVALIWNPLKFIGAFALLVFVLLLCVALVVRLLRAFVRARIFAYHAYTVTMWSTAPMLLLVPLGMVLYRVLDSSIYVVPAFVLIGVLCAWVFLRLLKGMSIVMDVPSWKVYGAGICSVAAFCAAGYLYYDYTQSAPMYLSFLYSTMLNTQ
ncbi:MAG TPA: glycoside hydrolase family 2 TIM barrel-domain containing protein [Bacteroidota bacterium]|nr:glycoside hydrolase family 2 TIM barrel-domain containing protein [Bacteroidota bacterium]